MFLATANVIDTVPAALKDRLEILELHGYTRDEKRNIARQFLVPKQLEEHGLHSHQIELQDDAVAEVIDSYTREAGVRNREREVGSIARGVAVKVAEGAKEKFVVTAKEVPDYLGPQKFMSEVAERTAEPGVATGLAWTPVGGDILFIEATRMPGKGSLVLTGQLGDVMKESAQAALSFVRAKAKWLGIDENFLDKTDIHVHIPAGGSPQDRPSAGAATFPALAPMPTPKSARNHGALTRQVTPPRKGALL